MISIFFFHLSMICITITIEVETSWGIKLHSISIFSKTKWMQSRRTNSNAYIHSAHAIWNTNNWLRAFGCGCECLTFYAKNSHRCNCFCCFCCCCICSPVVEISTNYRVASHIAHTGVLTLLPRKKPKPHRIRGRQPAKKHSTETKPASCGCRVTPRPLFYTSDCSLNGLQGRQQRMWGSRCVPCVMLVRVCVRVRECFFFFIFICALWNMLRVVHLSILFGARDRCRTLSGDQTIISVCVARITHLPHQQHAHPARFDCVFWWHHHHRHHHNCRRLMWDGRLAVWCCSVINQPCCPTTTTQHTTIAMWWWRCYLYVYLVFRVSCTFRQRLFDDLFYENMLLSISFPYTFASLHMPYPLVTRNTHSHNTTHPPKSIRNVHPAKDI